MTTELLEAAVEKAGKQIAVTCPHCGWVVKRWPIYVELLSNDRCPKCFGHYYTITKEEENGD